jgi:hypothetical protein
MSDLRRIQYERDHGPHRELELHEGSLLTFVYDIPYFPPCGIFPPFHILNQFFALGHGGGGMGPGAEWEPFSVNAEEYRALVEALKATPLAEVNPSARYAWRVPEFDASLDHIENFMEWLIAACQKHGKKGREKVSDLGRSV